ncbi:MAG: hypothetical protein WAL72_11580 [Streptosporangiaceae bacterium]
MTWYRVTPSAGTTAWITPRDDIRKTLDFFELGGLRLGELALRSACPWKPVPPARRQRRT